MDLGMGMFMVLQVVLVLEAEHGVVIQVAEALVADLAPASMICSSDEWP